MITPDCVKTYDRRNAEQTTVVKKAETAEMEKRNVVPSEFIHESNLIIFHFHYSVGNKSKMKKGVVFLSKLIN